MTTENTAPEATAQVAAPTDVPAPVTEPQEPASPPDAAEDDTTDEHDLAHARKIRNENKNLRTRLRDAEAERDITTASLTGLQRQVAEMTLEGTGVTPAALWASGADVADLLDDDGRIDAGKVQAAARAASEKLGLVRTPAANPAQGTSAGGVAGSDGDPWTAAFSGKATR